MSIKDINFKVAIRNGHVTLASIGGNMPIEITPLMVASIVTAGQKFRESLGNVFQTASDSDPDLELSVKVKVLVPSQQPQPQQQSLYQTSTLTPTIVETEPLCIEYLGPVGMLNQSDQFE